MAYLASLRGPGEQEQLQREALWQPSANEWSRATEGDGAVVFQQHCATCHDEQGAARQHWMRQWCKLPGDLFELRAFAANQPRAMLARISKFGIPGTDMPGHEYLSDRQIVLVALWLKPGAWQDATK